MFNYLFAVLCFVVILWQGITFGENMDNKDFRRQLANQFAAVTCESEQNSEQILFENRTFNAFDLAFGEPKLDLVRSELMFFENGMLSNDTENSGLLKEMLTEAQQTIFDYSVQLVKGKNITKDAFKERAKKFVEATTNNALKSQATMKAEKILGETLVPQYV